MDTNAYNSIIRATNPTNDLAGNTRMITAIMGHLINLHEAGYLFDAISVNIHRYTPSVIIDDKKDAVVTIPLHELTAILKTYRDSDESMEPDEFIGVADRILDLLIMNYGTPLIAHLMDTDENMVHRSWNDRHYLNRCDFLNKAFRLLQIPYHFRYVELEGRYTDAINVCYEVPKFQQEES